MLQQPTTEKGKPKWKTHLGLAGRKLGGGCFGRWRSDVLFIEVHIEHTGVEFGNVGVVTVNEVVGVLLKGAVRLRIFLFLRQMQPTMGRANTDDP